MESKENGYIENFSLEPKGQEEKEKDSKYADEIARCTAERILDSLFTEAGFTKVKGDVRELFKKTEITTPEELESCKDIIERCMFLYVIYWALLRRHIADQLIAGKTSIEMPSVPKERFWMRDHKDYK